MTAATFADLGLPAALVDALARGGIDAPFPIQAATIADALAGRDVLGKARTGSGKTLAFGLPALARLADTGRAQPHRPRAIVLVPTRELAMQVNDALEPLAHALQVSVRLVAGGLSMSKQITALERGVHLVIATPGRLADLNRRGHADLSDCELVILDEADHMAEMGFMTEITELLAQVPVGGQRLLFSATLDGDVDTVVKTYMKDPVLHDVSGGDDSARADMTHLVFHIPPHEKYQAATRIASRDGRTMVFVRTKLGCERIAEQMRAAGVTALALHGDKTQNERNAAIKAFRGGSVPVLVATDVAARGIHVDAVDLVLQIDPPADHKDYTHRAGRTARAGAAGLVVTLALAHQRRTVAAMLERAGVKATVHTLKNLEGKDAQLIDSLTGAKAPSGIPVPAPQLARSERQPLRGNRSARHSSKQPSWYSGDSDRADAVVRAEDALRRREEQLRIRERELERRERELAGAQRRPERTTSQARPPRVTSQSKESGPSRKPPSRQAPNHQPPAAAGAPVSREGKPERKPRHSKQDGPSPRAKRPASVDKKSPSRRGKPRPKKKR